MITKEELIKLINSDETYRIEKTISTSNMDKFCQAICAFSNDMAGSGKKGYLLLGVYDDGSLSGLKCNDELNQKISAIRSDGNILPIPVMNVESFSFDNGDVLVVEVTPSMLAPVRYRGRTYIRVGARKDFASIEEERVLSERASKFYATYDSYPCKSATLDDIEQKLFLNDYLPLTITEEVLIEDTRSIKEQMTALHLYDMGYNCPTYAAIILFGKDPTYFMFGAYIQYVRFDGINNSADIINEHEFKGPLVKLLPELDSFVNISLIKKYPIPITVLKEKTVYNYPQWAMRELIMNAVMHRDYQSNSPIKIYEYNDRIEISNAGGLYGNARPDNFPTVNDYRNPVIALAMKYLKYVNKYNRGVSRVEFELEENGNGKADFSINKITVFDVIVNISNKINDKLNIQSDGFINNSGNNVTNSNDKTNKVGNNITDSDDKTNKVSNNVTNSNDKTNKVGNNITDSDDKTNKVGNNITDSDDKTNKVSNNVTNSDDKTNKVSNNVTDSDDKTNKVKKEKNIDNGRIIKILLGLSKVESLSSKEIFPIINLSHQSSNYRIINKMIDLGYINRINDKPKAPNQGYKITELGLEFIREFSNLCE
ncbi:MAG: putative DNA binding domain-containing protein [Rikenellaceae bacterium]